MNYDNFPELLKSIQRPFDGAITDLRSQVVREACITLAFLSLQLKNKLATFVEAVLVSVMNLIQNSAKVRSPLIANDFIPLCSTYETSINSSTSMKTSSDPKNK